MPFTVFDLHCDTADRLGWQTLSHNIRIASGMNYYGPGDELDPSGCRELLSNRCHFSLERIGDIPWVQCFACFIPDELNPELSLDFYRHINRHLDEIIARCDSKAVIARQGNEIRTSLNDAALVGVRTIENARFFAIDPELVDEAASDGVIMASLSWNASGPLASGHDTNDGITLAGRAALKRMETIGITVDVSHLNDRCFEEVAAATNAPLVASHSNSRAICGHPRNLTDSQFDCIRERGGIVGLNYCTDFLCDSGSPNFDDISRHIDHWLERDGEDILALGSDFDGCDTPDCISTASDMPAFQSMLEKRFGPSITAKLCGENALRFFS